MLINRQVVKRVEADRRTDKQTPSVQRPSNSNTHMALYTQMDKHKGDRRLVRGDGSIRLFVVSLRSVCVFCLLACVQNIHSGKLKRVIPVCPVTLLQFTSGLPQQLSTPASLSKPNPLFLCKRFTNYYTSLHLAWLEMG